MGIEGVEPGHRIEHAVESTAAKAVSRWVVPVLLAIIGFFLVKVLDTQQKQGDDIVAIKQQMAVMNTMLAERVIRQVDINTTHLSKHDDELTDLKARVGQLEHQR